MRWLFCRGKAGDLRGAERRLAGSRRDDAGGVTSVKGLRVLLLDDGDTRDFLANTLRHYEADVSAAGSVRDALAALERTCPQVLVCNCDLTDVEAAMLVQAVRRLEAAQQRRIPTIAVGADSGLRRLTLGVQISLPRPLTPQTLMSTISKLALAQPAA